MVNYKTKSIYLLFILFLACLVTIWFKFKSAADPCDSLHVQGLPANSSQVILVHFIEGSKVQLTACQKQGKSWTHALKSSFYAVTGKAGIAPLGEKKEGDMRTPAGLYPLGEAFGSEPLALKMDYKYITADDKFVDDVTHKQYNQWVHGETDAKSYETMLYDGYRMGVVINYNMNPVVPGAGSAIFIHLWRSIDTPTHGCIAMDEHHLLELLFWLDKKQQPYIYIP